MAAFGGPGGVLPCTGSGWRVAGLGAVLPEGDQRRAIRHPQIKLRDEAVIDHLLDHCGCCVGRGVAIGGRGRSERMDSGRSATVTWLPIARDDGTARVGPSGTTTRLAPSTTRSTRPRKKFAAPRKSATKRDTGR